MNNYATEALNHRIRNLVVQKTTSPKGYHKDIDEEISDLQQAISQLSQQSGEVIAEGIVNHEKYTYKVFIGKTDIDSIPETLNEILEEYHDELVRLVIHKCKESK